MNFHFCFSANTYLFASMPYLYNSIILNETLKGLGIKLASYQLENIALALVHTYKVLNAGDYG